MTVHPDIGFYGDHRNREWKQYALPDDNEPEMGACPFHTRTNGLRLAFPEAEIPDEVYKSHF
jgi:FPC/CPF motif-containing protein YcgG